MTSTSFQNDVYKFGKRIIESLGSSELKRLRMRYEARKESLTHVAKAFNVGAGLLVKYARENKWKKSSIGKVYAHEKEG